MLSARREAAAGTRTSARSLLLTLLGEFVLSRPGAVWTQTIVGALDQLGVEEKAARQALARTAADGWLTSERVGRSVRWSLTESGRQLLTAGAERIYAFAERRPDWDGTWFIVNVSVPETLRGLRHRLRTRLSWAGFGSPEPGMWIAPSAAHEAEARAIIDELGLDGQAMSFTARFAGIGRERAMVERAWNLAAVAARYEEFIATFGLAAPVRARRGAAGPGPAGTRVAAVPVPRPAAAAAAAAAALERDPGPPPVRDAARRVGPACPPALERARRGQRVIRLRQRVTRAASSSSSVRVAGFAVNAKH